MSAYVPIKQHLRGVLLFLFNSRKSAAESHRLPLKTYGGSNIPSISTCEYWYRRFENSDFDVEDRERPGQPKKFEDEELEILLDEDPCRTQEVLAKS